MCASVSEWRGRTIAARKYVVVRGQPAAQHGAHAADGSGLGDQWQCSTEYSVGRGDGRSALRTDEGEP